MIDPTARLSVSRQAVVLGISRGAVYYRPRPVSDADQRLMNRIDRLHTDHPFAGSRMLQGLLVQEGFKVGRKHVRTLMKRMGIEAIYRRPNTSKPAPGHKIYPYLLRNLSITRPNQVWAMDITYIPMARGFIYLAAVVDWFSRRVLAAKVSISLEADFCIEAVEEALARYGQPEIFNTDQGSQFTSTDFIKVLASREIKISMDGKGAWRDNVFVERLWRTIKYEEVYLKAYASVPEARASINHYLAFYNSRRPHSSLDGRTPDQAYFNPPKPEVTNVRKTWIRHWQQWLGVEHRCVVPATAFSEYGQAPDPVTKRKPLYWFALRQTQPLFFFAGIWTRWEGTRGSNRTPRPGKHELFAFLTTGANEVVKPIHPKAMPVILTRSDEVEVWLTADWREAKALQRPLPADLLEVIEKPAAPTG